MQILYGTSGCHLCDDAQALLTQSGIAFTTKDIMDEDELFTKYAQHIPVFVTDLGTIFWPFDAAQALRISVKHI